METARQIGGQFFTWVEIDLRNLVADSVPRSRPTCRMGLAALVALRVYAGGVELSRVGDVLGVSIEKDHGPSSRTPPAIVVVRRVAVVTIA